MTPSITPLADSFENFCERYQLDGTIERITSHQAFMQGALCFWLLLQQRNGSIVADEMEAYRSQFINYTEHNPMRDKMI